MSNRTAAAVDHAAGFVVGVEETITAALAGHDGCRYQSPPLPHADALALVRILTGGAGTEVGDGDGSWTCPIAGGRRTVTLRAAASVTDSIV